MLHLCCTLLCGPFKAVFVCVNEHYCCFGLRVLAKTGLFLALIFSSGIPCHDPIAKLTDSPLTMAV